VEPEAPKIPLESVLNAVKLPRNVTGSIQEAVQAIDSVHGVPVGMSPLSLELTNARSRAGSFRYWERKLRISRQWGDREGFTTIHEFGHALDYDVLDSERKWASTAAPILDDWRSAVSNSRAVKGLEQLLRTPSVQVTLPNNEPFRYTTDRKYIRYLLQNNEIFARSYTQYIATKSANPHLVAWVKQERGAGAMAGSELYYPNFWDDDDFAPIIKAFDNLFGKLGWVR